MLVWWRLSLTLLCFSGFPLKFDFIKTSFGFLQCVLEDSSNPSDPLVAAAPVPLHVWEHSCLMRPVIIFRPEEKHREFSNLVLHFLNIWGNIFGMANFCWPPSVVPKFDPNDVLKVELLPSSAVIAEPAAIRHLDAQTIRVEGCRTGLAAQKASPFGAHEAPAHIDMSVVPLPLAGSEVACADYAVRSNHGTSRCQAGIPAMIGDRASDAPHHFTF